MMTPFENATYVTTQINDIMKSNIERSIKSHFGVDVNLKATLHKGGWDGFYTTFEDENTDVDNKMRSNKIQRSLFKKVTLYGDAWYDEPNTTLCLRINVSYQHVGGGSNGHEIGMMYLNVNTNKVNWKKYE